MSHQRRLGALDGVSEFFTEINRMRELGRRGVEHAGGDQERGHATAWLPAIDVFSSGEDLVIRVELAGMSPEEVEITFSRDLLTIAGVRQTALGTDGDDSFYVRERPYGAFRRVVTLPGGTTDGQISAEFLHGLVEIRVEGVADAARPARIAIRDRTGEA